MGVGNYPHYNTGELNGTILVQKRQKNFKDF